MGIEATGDPLWFDGLSVDRQNAVLGLLHVDSEEIEAAQKARKAPPKPKPTPSLGPPSGEGFDPDAWERLQAMPGVRIGGR